MTSVLSLPAHLGFSNCVECKAFIRLFIIIAQKYENFYRSYAYHSLDLMDFAIRQDDDGHFQKESFLHNLIYPMRTTAAEYVALLKTNKVKDKNGRIIRVGENTKFYLYAVCDITNTLEQIIDFHDFSQTPDKMGYYKYNDKMNAYIVSYDKIINDVQKRNKILFDKLGI